MLIYQYQYYPEEIPIDDIIKHVSELLTTLHNNGIIHRDVHLQNIFYKYPGKYVIGDYGQAVLSDSPPISQGRYCDIFENITIGRDD